MYDGHLVSQTNLQRQKYVHVRNISIKKDYILLREINCRERVRTVEDQRSENSNSYSVLFSLVVVHIILAYIKHLRTLQKDHVKVTLTRVVETRDLLLSENKITLKFDTLTCYYGSVHG